MEKKHSFFMKDKQNSDKIESLVDAFLSWTLQCCDTSKVERYNNSKLHEYSKRITSVLLFGNPDELNKYEILSVETWRQWKSIDLCAEVFLKNKETQKDEKYALLIENKGYSSTHSDQLARYKTIFENHYKDKGFKSEFIYFSCKDNLNDTEKKDCMEAGYRAYTMDQVFDLANPNKDWDYTGNALFDEFWFTTW
jgi:hypothetical protein